MRKTYILSGVSIGDSGIGRMLSVLGFDANGSDFIFVQVQCGHGLRDAFSSLNIYKILKSTFKFLSQKLVFYIKIFFISRSNVVYIFPQGGGHWIFNWLLLKKNRVFFYVMDNSFFCIKSYNYHEADKGECFKCIDNNVNPDGCCSPFPFSKSRKKSISEIKKLKKLSGKIIFLAQNQRQRDLLVRFYGEIRCEIVGLCVGLAPSKSLPTQPMVFDESKRHLKSFIYHGSANLAKGVGFFVELSHYMPDFLFVIPDDEIVVKSVLGLTKVPSNVCFYPCRWETGLENLVRNGDIVFVPSIWSSPIEGALIKSLKYAKCVVSIRTEMGYAEEISELNHHFRVSPNPSVAASNILGILNNHYKTESAPEVYFDFNDFSREKVLFRLQSAISKYQNKIGHRK